jgi:hypothetical protein
LPFDQFELGASSRGGLENHHHSEQTINCHVRPWFQATQKNVIADQARASQANPELDLDDALKRATRNWYQDFRCKVGPTSEKGERAKWARLAPSTDPKVENGARRLPDGAN